MQFSLVTGMRVSGYPRRGRFLSAAFGEVPQIRGVLRRALVWGRHLFIGRLPSPGMAFNLPVAAPDLWGEQHRGTGLTFGAFSFRRQPLRIEGNGVKAVALA